jgi:hypothetical protein
MLVHLGSTAGAADLVEQAGVVAPIGGAYGTVERLDEFVTLGTR